MCVVMTGQPRLRTGPGASHVNKGPLPLRKVKKYRSLPSAVTYSIYEHSQVLFSVC